MTDNKPLEDILKELKQYAEEQKQILDHLAQVEKPLWVQEGEKKKLLRIGEIAFMTTNEKGLELYTIDGKKYINFDSISHVEKEFAHDQRLMKTHRSFIVNLNHIDTIATVSGGRNLTFKGLSEEIMAKVTYEYVDRFLERLGASNEI